MSTGAGMVFEDKDGNLRIVDTLPCGIDPEQLGAPRIDVLIKRK